jgi:RNA polymerase sigma-70 factor (ECF subfamily)
VGTRGTDLRPAQSDYRSLDDRMLVLDFQAGHPEAFVEIHHRYGPLARRVCSRYLHNGQDADEAFQETMIRVFQGLHRFNGQYALRPWIARIATNVSIDALRAHDRRPEIDDGSMEEHDRPDPDDDPEQAFERLIERDLVISVLEELPETHRTALVLRELEGRSHKEIGHALGLSSAQAKALIHRARGSFRRGWLRAMTERGGLAGIAMLPLIVTIKVFDGARKVVDRVVGHAGQVTQAATPDVITQAASSPAVTNAVSSVGERVVATGMAVLIAGSVTVGAASLAKHDDSQKPTKVVAAAAPMVDSDTTTVPPVDPSVDRPQPKEAKPHDGPVAAEGEEAGTSEVPATTPTSDPTGSPSPDPSPSPTPPPPAPPWSASFDASVGLSSAELTSVSHPTVTGRWSDEVLFSQTMGGVVVGSDGEPVGSLYVDLTGVISGGNGFLSSLWLWIDTADGHYAYACDGALSAFTEAVDGSSSAVFTGRYALSEAPASVQAVSAPHDGIITVSLGFWSDGSLYVADVSMGEA